MTSHLLSHLDHHHEELYAHPHHVMHRIKPSMLKRSDTDVTFDQRTTAAMSGQKVKPRAMKSLRSSDTLTLTLPTIQDEDSIAQIEEKK